MTFIVLQERPDHGAGNEQFFKNLVAKLSRRVVDQDDVNSVKVGFAGHLARKPDSSEPLLTSIISTESELPF